MDFRKQHLEAFQKKYGMKLGFMSAFCKAAAYALQDQPVVNAVIGENVSLLFHFILYPQAAKHSSYFNPSIHPTGDHLPGLR